MRVEPRVTSRVAGSRRRSPTVENGRPLCFAAAGKRSQAREQLGEGERLDQVVVGAAVEAGDPILDPITRRQHQDRRPHPGGTQPATRLEAVQPGQHHIQHDRVVVVRLRRPERVLAGGRDIRGEPLRHEPAADQARHPQVVLDDQNTHAPILRADDERKMTAR